MHRKSKGRKGKKPNHAELHLSHLIRWSVWLPTQSMPNNLCKAQRLTVSCVARLPHQPLAWFFGCYQQVTKAENISNNDLIRKPELKRT